MEPVREPQARREIAKATLPFHAWIGQREKAEEKRGPKIKKKLTKFGASASAPTSVPRDSDHYR